MTTRNYTDQMGNPVKLPFPPRRIVSLVPSQTEFLAALGLENEVVGVTKFCIHPREWSFTKSIVGGTKQFDFDIIHALSPDLIIGNKEENYREGIENLKASYPVWMSDIYSLEDALAMMRSIGEVTDRVPRSIDITEKIQRDFRNLKGFSGKTVLYLIWRKPWMAAGPNTFVNDILTRIGLRNAVAAQRYPELIPEEMASLKPDVVLLSSEPFPFKEKHISEIEQILPGSKVVLVDGEMFSWYGSRLMYACDYFRTLQSTTLSSIQL